MLGGVAHVEDPESEGLAAKDGGTGVVDDGKEVLVASHGHDWGGLAEDSLLDTFCGKYSDVTEISVNRAPPRATG